MNHDQDAPGWVRRGLTPPEVIAAYVERRLNDPSLLSGNSTHGGGAPTGGTSDGETRGSETRGSETRDSETRGSDGRGVGVDTADVHGAMFRAVAASSSTSTSSSTSASSSASASSTHDDSASGEPTYADFLTEPAE